MSKKITLTESLQKDKALFESKLSEANIGANADVNPYEPTEPTPPSRKVKDELALRVKELATEFFQTSPYSSARISGGTVHRLSYPLKGFLLAKYKMKIDRYRPKISPDVKTTLVKISRDFLNFLKANGVDTSKVACKFHAGAGLYASVQTQISE